MAGEIKYGAVICTIKKTHRVALKLLEARMAEILGSLLILCSAAMLQ